MIGEGDSGSASFSIIVAGPKEEKHVAPMVYNGVESGSKLPQI